MSTSTYLKEERARLRLSQSELAAAGGVTSKTQGNYESGLRSPDAAYLAAVAHQGVDVMYVITGLRNHSHASDAAQALSIEEWRTIIRYRKAPVILKAVVHQVLDTKLSDAQYPDAPLSAEAMMQPYTGLPSGGYTLHAPVTTYNQQGDVHVATGAKPKNAARS